jgi:hypothetical protein
MIHKKVLPKWNNSLDVVTKDIYINGHLFFSYFVDQSQIKNCVNRKMCDQKQIPLQIYS